MSLTTPNLKCLQKNQTNFSKYQLYFSNYFSEDEQKIKLKPKVNNRKKCLTGVTKRVGKEHFVTFILC